MKNFNSLRAGVALAALPLGLVGAAAVPVIAFGQSAPSKGNFETPMTDNAVDSTLMVTALTMAGYDAKLISEGEQAPIIRVTRGQLDFTINFENCIFDGCTRARFTKTFGGDFSSSKTAAWNNSEESDAVADSGGAGKLGLDLKIFDPKIDTARFNAHVDVWLATLPRFETFVGGSAMAQPTKATIIEKTEPQPELKDTTEEPLFDTKSLRPAIKIASADIAYSLRDYTKALVDYKWLSDSGDADYGPSANLRLGRMFQLGFGVDVNETEAIKYYKLAANSNKIEWKSEAQYELGDIYYHNDEFADAAREFRSFLAAPGSTDTADARYKLAMLYNLGNGVAQDHALAAEQFALADVGKGSNNARYELGMLYLKGKGVDQDFTSAAEYLKKAAVYNKILDVPTVPDAQYVLSTLYAAGKGVTQSDGEAVKFLRLAAKEDHTKAQFGLGMMFAAGKGVTQSMSIAYLWLARAAEGDAAFRSVSATTKTTLSHANGIAEAIKARDAIRARLTPAQLAEAQVLVDRCVSSKYACDWGG